MGANANGTDGCVGTDSSSRYMYLGTDVSSGYWYIGADATVDTAMHAWM